MNEIKGKVYSPLAIDKTLTQEYMCADAKATGDAINNLRTELNNKIDTSSNVDYYENITINGNAMAQGRCFYLEENGVVFIHLLATLTQDIASGQTFAILNGLSKNMRNTDNVGIITADGTVYPFNFNGKNITTLTAIPSGKVIGIDICIGLT